MPDDPQQKMDDLLRRYAEERRKAAEVTLHPATRQMLKGEVSRVFGTASAKSGWFNRLRAFWPQIAFAGGLCLVFGIAVLSLRQPGGSNAEKQTEALSDKVETISKDEATAPVELKLERDQATEPPTPLFDQSKSAQRGESISRSLSEEESLQRNRSLGASAPTAQEPPQLQRASPGKLDSYQERTQPTLSDAPPAQDELQPLLKQNAATKTAAPTPSSRGVSEKRVAPPSSNVQPKATVRATTAAVNPAEKNAGPTELTNLGAALRLNFVQVPETARSDATPIAKSPVLNTFQVEQTGADLRFYDQDGSVYRGTMKPAGATATLTSVKAKEEQALIQNAAAYDFTVQGSNRTWGGELIFTGQYITETNTQPSTLDTFAIAPDAKARQQVTPRYLIIGNATIGRTNQLPVRATAK